MLRLVKHAVALGLWAIVAGAGCAYGEVRHVVRAQFASDVDCGDVLVEKKGFAYQPDAGDHERYKVTGCGVERTYTCPRDAGLVSYGEATCTWVLGDPDRPVAAQTSAGSEDPFASDEPAQPAAPDEAAAPVADDAHEATETRDESPSSPLADEPTTSEESAEATKPAKKSSKSKSSKSKSTKSKPASKAKSTKAAKTP